MATFTPPSIPEVSPIGVADSRDGAPVSATNPFGQRLMRFFSTRPRGVLICKMSDGTYQANRNVTGLTVGSGGSVTVAEPYPGVPELPSNASEGISVPNDCLDQSYYAGVRTVEPLQQPTVAHVYYGGHSYQVNAAEASALTAAGFGAYIT